jgi:hypothetical protein
MTRHRARLRVPLALAISAVLLLSPAAARGDSATSWNLNASNALLRDAGQTAIGIADLAMVQGAVFDAVNSIDHRYKPYLTRVPAQPGFSQDAAVAAAAHRVLVSGHVVADAQQAALEATVEPEYAAALAAIPDGTAKQGGIATGEAAAWAMIAARTGDGRFGAPGFVLRPPGPGVWEPTLPSFVNDPGAWLRNVKPFMLRDPDRFLSRGPDPLTSRRYARDYNEVKELGRIDSATRTDAQTTAARFWGGPTNAVYTWSELMRSIAGTRPMSTVESARFYALMFLNAADTAITTWRDKDRNQFWRPITAIQRGDTDGNDATVGDPTWLPLIPTPPYPDHPSGLSAFSASNAATARDVLGTDEVTFTATNSIGITRSYSRLSQAPDEVIDARVWSGIHFRNADEQGARIGREVARWRQAHGFLRPLRHHH